jgi:amino acid adenylation domain-containing protein
MTSVLTPISPSPDPAASGEVYVFPASFAQQRLWFLERLEPDQAVYNMPRAMRLHGRLDGEALRRALEEIVRRHEALRTVFRARDAVPLQVVLPPGPLHLPLRDLSALSAPAREDALRGLVRDEERRPFDLAAGPLFRATLVRLGGEEHALLWSMHHIVGDGWSLGVFHRELAALYGAFTRGAPSPLEELPVQYADYTLWQREYLKGEVLERQLAYWSERLAGAPALLELPADRPRPPVQTFQGAYESIELPGELAERLRALGRREGATLFLVLLAAFQVLLGRYAGSEDVVVGTPIAGRTRAGTEELIGFFVNTLVLRTDLSGDPSFRDVLRRVREATLGAYEHQDLPFEQLVAELAPERSLAHSPLFQVMFALNGPADAREGLPGLRTERLQTGLPTTKFDLSLGFAEHAGGLGGGIEYSVDLFDAATIRRMAAHLERVLEQVAADADARLSELELPGEAERRRVVEEWNRTEAPHPAGRCIHQLVEAQVERTPHAPAVVLEDQVLTYRELNGRANRLARYLRRLGVGPEVRVGVCLERGPEMVVAVLAAVKAGGAYVPLDPAYPPERLAFMLADSAAAVLLTQERLRAALPARAGTRVVSVDLVEAQLAGESAENPESGAGPRSPAYVIYTSGSTGTPKGVAIEHRAIVSYTTSVAREYALRAGDRFLQFSSISFDPAAEEIFATLLSGATMVLRTEGMIATPRAFWEACGRWSVGIMGLPTAVWHHVAPYLDARPDALPDSLRLVVIGGEAALPDRVRAWQSVTGGRVRLLNGYGPTETTIAVTLWEVPEGGDLARVSIGKPIANTRCYVLDAGMRPAGVGVPGELYAGGAQLARGYLGRPAATAARFVPDPLSGERGARLYRTGDRVRWLATGELEFLGRMDQQVKIRGFRIEPGEVEAALLSLPGVAEAVVEVRHHAGEKRLVGYVVPADADASAAHVKAARMKAALREALLARLPEYMVPAAFVVLEALPLTVHGKVDRRALPAPEWGSDGAERVAPRTPAEELLAGIWSEVLGREAVGVEEDFFALGGHSLLAMRVLLRVERSFAVDLPVRTIFEAPTVAALARRIEEARQGGEARERMPLRPAERGSEAALSFAQQRLWFVDQMEGAGAAYHVPGAVRLRGRLDGEALRRALEEIVRRHEALRTVFRVRDAEPLQVVLPPGPLDLPLHDLSALAADEREAALRARVREEARRPFDLAAGPLFRATLVRLGAEEHVLLVGMHHIVSDGWSLGVLHHELEALYGAFHRGEPSPLEALPVQYADYALWQRAYVRGEVLHRQLAWWKARLSGAPALLELPTDRPRPAVQTYRGARRPFHLDGELLRRLESVARGEGATLFMVLLAAFQVLLSKYAGTEDVVVGSPIAGRTRAETEGLIGVFVNTLALRADLSGDPEFREVLRRVREATLGAYEHQDLPFEKLVEELGIERSLGHTPIWQATFNLQTAGGELRLDGLAAEPLEVELDAIPFDLMLALWPGDSGLEGAIGYATDLFDAATIGRLGEHYGTLLGGIAADPGRRLSRLPLLGEAERRQVLADWNPAGAAPPVERCLHELFEAQAARTPAAVAVVHGDERITYAELDRRADGLAHALRARGVGPEARVGILLERGVGLVVATLATLKAGGAYVPLDPAYPPERRAYMLRDAGVRVLLAQEHLREGLPAEVEALCPESLPDAQGPPKPDSGAGPRNLAYVIYTSGSTGVPKGVMVDHAQVVRLFRGTAEACRFGAEDAWTLFHSAAFDFSVWEMWGALLHGGRLVVVPHETSRSPEELRALVLREGVTVLNQTPSAFRALIQADRAASPGSAPGALPLRLVVFGGEALDPRTLLPWMERHGEERPRLVNMYGITETTVHVTWRPLTLADARAGGSPIGVPLADLRAYVLDGHLEPVPVGVPGELFVGGAGVARGYLGRPGLTAQRFVPDPYGSEPGGRLYRSGDRVRWSARGELEYLGRTDAQVKVRGFRIEPGEIEAALRAQEEVREAVVLAREDVPGDPRLVAWLVPAPGRTAPASLDLRRRLRARLPEYMVPAAFVVVDAIPLTSNGKIDRRALPAPGREGAERGEYAAPRTREEKTLAAIWAEVLGVERVGMHDSFFDLGGHSLLLPQVQRRVSDAFRTRLPIVELFRHPTVAALAEHLRGAADAPGALPADAPAEADGSLQRLAAGRARLRQRVAVRGEGEG